jgi:hypothetical protein
VRREAWRNGDSPCLEIYLPHAGLDEREQHAGIKLEHVVGDSRLHRGDPAEGPSPLLLRFQADELEFVELPLARR